MWLASAHDRRETRCTHRRRLAIVAAMQQEGRTGRFGLLAVLVLLLTLGALVQDFRFDRSVSLERHAIAATERQIGSVEVALSDYRAAQAGYLALGQGPDFW